MSSVVVENTLGYFGNAVTGGPRADYRGTRHWYKHDRFLECKHVFEGAQGLFFAFPQVILVRVDQVKADDWGVEARISPLRSDVLPFDGSEPWNIGASWEVFSASEKSWGATYQPWRVIFSEPYIRAVLDRAAAVTSFAAAVAVSGAKLCRRQNAACRS